MDIGDTLRYTLLLFHGRINVDGGIGMCLLVCFKGRETTCYKKVVLSSACLECVSLDYDFLQVTVSAGSGTESSSSTECPYHCNLHPVQRISCKSARISS